MIRPLVFFLSLAIFLSNLVQANTYKSSIKPIPQSIQKKMKQYTWHPGCPVPINQLVLVTLPYWGFDQKTHFGQLIVHQEIAAEVLSIFNTLYKEKYPIQQMRLMEDFEGNDELAMQANNTSSFNCREVTNQPGIFSQHSYGRAIDINPLINPYVKAGIILPQQAAPFADRAQPYPGKITINTPFYQLFKLRDWDWGGSWFDLQDYQHFEKRANGEKRNPYGYFTQLRSGLHRQGSQ
ncbi:hypothetical protein Lbir_1055 [Legionella birminghamensis]|uniref:Uncharacterized protein conserved in bacteria n=1 Tax=Legionella birminghamensis TaxID=28083 RepID=A0A378I6C2_9GAMM|nr:M15 family metallopeptidase [Legionella birminghamensis]KTC73793.1 hypothetical protein Lbir_1055 [Legionella birminghamensis]STX30709.1 Uncharacterized protein conserved in bacteria [Legionella birminghamensis]